MLFRDLEYSSRERLGVSRQYLQGPVDATGATLQFEHPTGAAVITLMHTRSDIKTTTVFMTSNFIFPLF